MAIGPIGMEIILGYFKKTQEEENKSGWQQ